MPTAIRPIGHEDRLSLVEHLDELRSRLMICGAALIVAFGFAVWQNHRLLDIVNKPLAKTTAPGSKGSSAKLDATARSQIATRRALESGGIAFRALAKVKKRSSETRWQFNGTVRHVPTFSAGLALYKPGESPGAFIERADNALYRAKRLGRNRVELDQTYNLPELNGERTQFTSSDANSNRHGKDV